MKNRIENQLDPVIVERIQSLLMEGKTDTDEILKECINYSKKNVFGGKNYFHSKKLNKNFFPVKEQVQRCINKLLLGVEDSLEHASDFLYMDTRNFSETPAYKDVRRMRRDVRLLIHQIFRTTFTIDNEVILKQLKNNLQTLLVSLLKCMNLPKCYDPPILKPRMHDFASGPSVSGQDNVNSESISNENSPKPSKVVPDKTKLIPDSTTLLKQNLELQQQINTLLEVLKTPSPLVLTGCAATKTGMKSKTNPTGIQVTLLSCFAF